MRIEKITKLIFTKKGHYFKCVKNLTRDGIYQVTTDEGLFVLCDKEEVWDVSVLFEYIIKKRTQWEREKKLGEILM
jgi:hypothetical protein